MIDHVILAVPWAIAVCAFVFSIRRRFTKKTALLCGIASGVTSAAILYVYVRPAILDRQMQAVRQMAERNRLAQQYIEARKFQAAESLLFQVVAETKQITHDQLSLWEVSARSVELRAEAERYGALLASAEAVAALEAEELRAEAERYGALLKKERSRITSAIGALLQQRDYELAVRTLESAKLERTDTFAIALNDFVWHVISEEPESAELCLKQLTGTTIALDELWNVLTEERGAIQTRHRSIAEEVKGIVDAAPRTGDNSPNRRGRAMVWDFTNDGVEDAYDLLPDELRATSRDGVLTMFCIRKRKQVVVGHYSVSGAPGYQEHMDIAVVYWPSRECVGSTTVLGGMPRGMRQVTLAPEYGSSVYIKNWIEGLPLDKEVVPRRPVRSLEELRAYLGEQNASDIAQSGRQPEDVRIGQASTETDNETEVASTIDTQVFGEELRGPAELNTDVATEQVPSAGAEWQSLKEEIADGEFNDVLRTRLKDFKSKHEGRPEAQFASNELNADAKWRLAEKARKQGLRKYAKELLQELLHRYPDTHFAAEAAEMLKVLE